MIALDITMACALLLAFYVLACLIEAVAVWAINGVRCAWDAATVFEPTPEEREAWPDMLHSPEHLRHREVLGDRVSWKLITEPWNVGKPTILHTPGHDVTSTLWPVSPDRESSCSWAAFREFLTLCLEAAIFVGGLVAWGSILRAVWP